MARRNERIPDVGRLLRLRTKVKRELLGPDVASSITAFIAWKACLVAAATERGDDEQTQVESLLETALKQQPSLLRDPLMDFVQALRGLASPEITPMVKQDWLEDPEHPNLGSEVERVLRQLKTLETKLAQIPDNDLWRFASELTPHLRRVRHVVIGHARVMTTTVQFEKIVPAFEELTARLAQFQHQALNATTVEPA